jgi:mRNA-degrading endonuclease toxin of MazEF toxin-antitoxin module
MPVVVVAALTTAIKNSRLAVYLPAGQPLPRAGEILAFQVATIDKSRLDGYMGTLSNEQLGDLRDKLKLCWGLSD